MYRTVIVGAGVTNATSSNQALDTKSLIGHQINGWKSLAGQTDEPGTAHTGWGGGQDKVLISAHSLGGQNARLMNGDAWFESRCADHMPQ